MAATDDRTPPTGDTSEALEEAIRRFEEAWRRGENPSIVETLAASGPIRARLLEELLHIDLEFRLKAGDPARVEDYRRDFPEVRSDAALLLALIRTEATIRRRAEPGLRLAHYQARFEGLDGELERELGPLGLAVGALAAGRAEPPGPGPGRPEPGTPTPGRLGKFELRQRLGSGEFGIVFRAWDTILKREVAVKVPRPEVVESPPDLLIFLREARNAIHLKHSNIVAIHDAGPIEGTACVVREFIEGMTLAERLRSEPLGISESVALIAAVLDALAYAHRHGIVHRDLKPSNILLDGDGRPHLTDFGLAKRSTGDSTISPSGAVRVLIGTPAYMPPEQARGDARSVDERSDIYSVGVVLYELLTGSVPFRGRGRILQAQIEHAPPIPPSNLDEAIPLALESVCLRALAKHPDQRYGSAQDMARDLDNFVAGRPVIGLESSPAPEPRTAPRRWRLLAAIGSGFLLIGLLLAGAYGVVGRHRQREARLLATLVDDLEALDGSLDLGAAGPGTAAGRHLAVEAIHHRLEATTQFLVGHPELAARRADLLVWHADRVARLGDDGLTRQAWRSAVAALEPYVAGPSAAPRRREELAQGLMTLARIDAEGGRIDRARRLAERAASLWDGLADERRAHRGPSDVRRATLLSRAKALLEADRADRLAQRDPRRSRIEEVERVARSPRDDEGWSLDELRVLIAVEQGLATRARELRQPDEAAQWAGAALELSEASANRADDAAAKDQVARATALLGLAEASTACGASAGLSAPRAAIERLQLAAIRLDGALDRSPGDLDLRRDRVAVERTLGHLQLLDGASGRAVETLRRAQSWNRSLLAGGPQHQDLAQAARIDADLALAAVDAARPRIAGCARMARAAIRMGQAERLAPGLVSYGHLFRAFAWASLQLLAGRRPGDLADPLAPGLVATSGSGTNRGDREPPRRDHGPPAPAPLYRMSPWGVRSALGGDAAAWPRERRP